MMHPWLHQQRGTKLPTLFLPKGNPHTIFKARGVRTQRCVSTELGYRKPSSSHANPGLITSYPIEYDVLVPDTMMHSGDTVTIS